MSKTTMTAEDFISKLVDDAIPSTPWLQSTFENDFILLSEFSELEGPKPIFTIPDEPDTKFNLNTFAVRIMSVDCVSIMQRTDFSRFNIAGDIQVVLTELSEGAVAYVHHFVLYDIRARGFVRPFCLAYITRNHTELMEMFDQLQQFFSMISSLYHFGNTLSFINDLMLRKQHLVHLKEVLADKSCDIFVEEKMLSELQKKSITAQTLDEAMNQIKELLKVFHAYSKQDLFSNHQNVFQQRYQETLMKCFKEENYGSLDREVIGNNTNLEGSHDNVDDCNDMQNGILFNADCPKASHQVPADVMSSILGKKYDRPLRSLNDLCDVTFKPGLAILKYCLHSLVNRKIYMQTNLFNWPVMLEKGSQVQLGTSEFQLVSYIQTNCDCKKEICSEPISIKSFVNVFVEQAQSNLHGAVSTTYTLDGREKSPPYSINSSFLSFLKHTPISLPVSMGIGETKMSTKLGSFVNVSNCAENRDSYLVNDSLGTGDICGGNQSEGSSDSFKDALNIPYSESVYTISSSSTPDSFSAGIAGCSRSVSVLSDDNNYFDFKDALQTSKVSLLSLRNRYSFLLHAVYSLMIGRPLVILGEDKHMKFITKLVYKLANFLLPTNLHVKKFIPWMTGQFQLSAISSVGIIGISKSNKFPSSLIPYVTILDYEKQSLLAPPYSGNYLNEMFDINRRFETEISYRKYIQQIFAEICSTAYVQFAAMYAHSGKYNISHGYGQRIYSDVHMMQGKICPGDIRIIKEFVSNLKEQVLSVACENRDEINITIENKPEIIKLNNLKCLLFVNSYKRKK